MDFLLEPDVAFLNHGSFGACPRPVFEVYQRLQRRLEAQPVRFLQRELPELLAEARAALATELGARPADLVFVTNPTYAVNELARCLPLRAGDTVVTTNHEYGACSNAWRFMADRAGFEIVEAGLDATISTDEEFVEAVWSCVDERTRVLFASHITSPTALTLPIEPLVARARDAGVITVVDAAHVPGQLDVDLDALGADFVTGACHKWLCAPKGASFLHARAEVQHLVEPLVVGWGWGPDSQFDLGSPFLDTHEWLGTHDPAAVLSVPAALAFQRRHDWDAVRARCHDLAAHALERAAAVPGLARVHDDHRFAQMALIEVLGDAGSNPPADLQRRLRGHGVEVPVIGWIDGSGRARTFVRVSVQAYNDEADIDLLLRSLEAEVGRAQPSSTASR